MAGADRMGKPVVTSDENLRKFGPAAASFALSVALVLIGGSVIDSPAVLDLPGSEDFIVANDPIASVIPEASAPAVDDEALSWEPGDEDTFSSGTVGEPPDMPLSDSGSVMPGQTAASRVVEPAAIAPVQLPALELEREGPREPLSQLGQALPPLSSTEESNIWAGKPLFRPVAIESAVFESGSHTIAIDGVSSIPVGEMCTYEGRSWPCGVRARAAFRMWLRGRAVVCEASGEGSAAGEARARCTLAKQDVGGWLVEHGWALAAPGSPYVEAGERARAGRIGIFGAPGTSAIPDIPDAPAGNSPGSQPIMTEGGVDPQPTMEFGGAFPPAPPPP